MVCFLLSSIARLYKHSHSHSHDTPRYGARARNVIFIHPVHSIPITSHPSVETNFIIIIFVIFSFFLVGRFGGNQQISLWVFLVSMIQWCIEHIHVVNINIWLCLDGNTWHVKRLCPMNQRSDLEWCCSPRKDEGNYNQINCFQSPSISVCLVIVNRFDGTCPWTSTISNGVFDCTVIL